MMTDKPRGLNVKSIQKKATKLALKPKEMVALKRATGAKGAKVGVRALAKKMAGKAQGKNAMTKGMVRRGARKGMLLGAPKVKGTGAKRVRVTY